MNLLPAFEMFAGLLSTILIVMITAGAYVWSLGLIRADMPPLEACIKSELNRLGIELVKILWVSSLIVILIAMIYYHINQ